MIILFIVVNRDTPMLDPGSWTRMHWLHNIAQAPDSLRRIQSTAHSCELSVGQPHMAQTANTYEARPSVFVAATGEGSTAYQEGRSW